MNGNYGLAAGDYRAALKKLRPATSSVMDYGNYLGENQISPEFYNTLSGAEREALTQGYLNLNPAASPMQFTDIRSLGDFGEWLGTGNNAQTGLAALGTAAGAYGVYKQSKYNDKIAGLVEKQYNLYEQEVKRQQERQDRAQANYDAAQMV